MTAVEWLVNEIQTKHDKSFIEFYGSEIIQAKEMEKQQIIGFANFVCRVDYLYPELETKELLEIYKKEKGL